MRRHLPTQSSPLQATGAEQPTDAQTHSPSAPTLLTDEIIACVNWKEREDIISSHKIDVRIYTLTHKLEKGDLLYA